MISLVKYNGGFFGKEQKRTEKAPMQMHQGLSVVQFSVSVTTGVERIPSGRRRYSFVHAASALLHAVGPTQESFASA